MKVTVFTPTYNRACHLRTLYDSLCRQTCKDFEWLVVDDGSADGTKAVIDDIIGRNPSFDVSYVYKENGGKHTAVNVGVRMAKGELFLIVDSDDCLVVDAVETIICQYETVSGNEEIGGVCGLMAHRNGSLIGTGFVEDEMICNSIDLRSKYRVRGDLCEVFKTDVLRKYPFPEINGERFCPEVLVWNRIAMEYKLKCFKKVVYYRDYLDGGLTSNIVKIRMNSPIASMMCYSEVSMLAIPLSLKMKAAINYWRFRFCAASQKELPQVSLWTYFFVPFALLLHLLDKYKCRG